MGEAFLPFRHGNHFLAIGLLCLTIFQKKKNSYKTRLPCSEVGWVWHSAIFSMELRFQEKESVLNKNVGGCRFCSLLRFFGQFLQKSAVHSPTLWATTLWCGYRYLSAGHRFCLPGDETQLEKVLDAEFLSFAKENCREIKWKSLSLWQFGWTSSFARFHSRPERRCGVFFFGWSRIGSTPFPAVDSEKRGKLLFFRTKTKEPTTVFSTGAGADPGFWSGGPVEFWLQRVDLSPKFAQNMGFPFFLKTAWFWKKKLGARKGAGPWIRQWRGQTPCRNVTCLT